MMKQTLPISLEETIKKTPLIIGIGPTAWPRMLSFYFFPKFKTISYYDTQDNELIKKEGVEVFSLKEIDPYIELSPVTPGNVLDLPQTKKYLNEQTEPFVLLVYKSFGKLEKVCEENGWKFLGNLKEIIDTYENKKIFKESIRELGIGAIPGENMPIEELTKEKFVEFQKKLGTKKLVLQIAEVTYGGGSGTLFANDPKDLDSFHARVKELRDALGDKKEIKSVNIAPFIEGITTSIACCTTKYGVLTGSIQNQIVDIPEVGAIVKNRSGNFAGHDWEFKYYPESCQLQAQKIAERWGDFLYKKGFKGIFGLDLIVDKNLKVWPVECNPRETDAFPLICMLQMENGAVPMQVFHNLEHLGVDYKIDFEETNKKYKKKFSASQILIYNPYEESAVDTEVFKAGVYKVENKKLKFLRSGFQLSDLKDESEFLFTEDIAKKSGKVYKPHERILRLIKRGGILKTEESINDDVKEVVDLVYKEIKLRPVSEGHVETEGFNAWFSNRIIDLKKAELKDIDLVNVVNETKDGIRRPVKIAWRKKITDEPILNQIPSKRARKQIASDLKKLESLNVSVKIIEELDDTSFLNWFEIYKKVISEKGTLPIDESWLSKKKKENKKIGGIFVYKNNKMIGGQIFSEINKVLGVGYSAAERIEGLLGSLTLVMDYKFLDYAKEKSFKEVSFGQDTNLYGGSLSTGLISYKLKLGFLPKVANKTYFVSSYILTNRIDPIMFFSLKNDDLVLTIITDKKDELDLTKFSFLDKSLIDVLDASTLIENHKKIILKKKKTKNEL